MIVGFRGNEPENASRTSLGKTILRRTEEAHVQLNLTLAPKAINHNHWAKYVVTNVEIARITSYCVAVVLIVDVLPVPCLPVPLQDTALVSQGPVSMEETLLLLSYRSAHVCEVAKQQAVPQ